MSGAQTKVTIQIGVAGLATIENSVHDARTTHMSIVDTLPASVALLPIMLQTASVCIIASISSRVREPVLALYGGMNSRTNM